MQPAPSPTPTDYSKPHAVSPLDAAFPTSVVGSLLPPWDTLPEDFRNNWHRNPWCGLAAQFFYDGGNLPALRAGVDRLAAVQHIGACLRSFQPQHEHKMAGVGYLLSLWCEPVGGAS